jgi:type I restriction enzyme S subunit
MDSKTFFDNFQTIANAPGGISRLRELILDLAIRGRLIPEHNSTSRDESGFPTKWISETLEEAAEYVQRGKGPKYADKSEVAVVSQKCVRWSGFDISEARFVDATSLSSYKEDRFLRSGDLLWNSTGTGTVGRTALFHEVAGYPKVVADSHVTVIRAPKILPRFLWTWSASPSIQSEVLGLTTGSTNQQELNLSTIKGLVIALPPMDEQKRIVARVDELMALCDELEAAQNLRDSIRTTARKSAIDGISTATTPDELNAAWKRISNNWLTIADTLESISSLRTLILDLATLGKLGTQVPSEVVKTTQQLTDVDELFPRNWKFMAFSDGCNIEGGNQPPKSKFINEPKSGYVRLFQIRDYGNNPVPTYIPEGSTNRFSKPGDVLIGRYGASIGKIFRASDGAYNVALAKFIYPKDLFRSEFIYWVLRSSRSQSIFTNMTRSAQAGFNKNDLAALNLPCPPLGEQDRIIVQLSSLMGLCDELEESLLRQVDMTRKLAGAMTAEVAA